jgi:copper(I)-binding protein
MYKKDFRKRLGSVLLCLVAAATPALSAESGLGFDQAWVRAAPPGARMMAAYGRFENHTDTALALSEFSSPAFRKVSLHRTFHLDGVSRMEAVSVLTVPAGGSVSLEPGGLHLMLHGPKSALALGSTVVFDIRVADGAVHSFELAVEKR